VQTIVTLLRDMQGQPRRIVGVVEDITEHLRLAEAERARELAEAANRAKSDFLSRMSHELRTPLNAIIGFSEIISSEMMGPIGVPQYKTYIEDIMQAGRHLLGVINDILDMSKIEAQQMKIRRELIDIPSMLRDVQRLLGPQAKAAGIEVTLLFPEGLVPVPGDPIRLRQILLNLLSNAIKFTPDGGTVQAGAENSGSDSIDLFVRDNGVGMTAEEVEIAMQPFRQVASVFAREHQGTGLGLPLSAALAELHGGKLLVQSQPGVGTKVIVTLPLQPDETTLQ
jgi:signal transduction histidine kinase